MNATGDHPTTLRREIAAYNRALSSICEARGVSLLEYKAVKWLTMLAAVAALTYMGYLGADPLIVAVLIGAVVLGIDVIETLVVENAVEINVESREDD